MVDEILDNTESTGENSVTTPSLPKAPKKVSFRNVDVNFGGDHRVELIPVIRNTRLFDFVPDEGQPYVDTDAGVGFCLSNDMCALSSSQMVMRLNNKPIKDGVFKVVNKARHIVLLERDFAGMSDALGLADDIITALNSLNLSAGAVYQETEDGEAVAIDIYVGNYSQNNVTVEITLPKDLDDESLVIINEEINYEQVDLGDGFSYRLCIQPHPTVKLKKVVEDITGHNKVIMDGLFDVFVDDLNSPDTIAATLPQLMEKYNLAHPKLFIGKADCEPSVVELYNSNYELQSNEEIARFSYYLNDGELTTVSFRLAEMGELFYSPEIPTTLGSVIAYIIDTYFNDRLKYEVNYYDGSITIYAYGVDESGFVKDPVNITFPETLEELPEFTFDVTGLMDVSTRVWHTCGYLDVEYCTVAPSEWSNDITFDMVNLPNTEGYITFETTPNDWNAGVDITSTNDMLTIFNQLVDLGCPIEVREGSVENSVNIRFIPLYSEYGRYPGWIEGYQRYEKNPNGALANNMGEEWAAGTAAETICTLSNFFENVPVVSFCTDPNAPEPM